jgi:hypothetical protein
MFMPLTMMLKQHVEIGRAQGQKEYDVQIGPIPEVAALFLQSVFSERGSPVEVRLTEAADHSDR